MGPTLASSGGPFVTPLGSGLPHKEHGTLVLVFVYFKLSKHVLQSL